MLTSLRSPVFDSKLLLLPANSVCFSRASLTVGKHCRRVAIQGGVNQLVHIAEVENIMLTSAFVKYRVEGELLALGAWQAQYKVRCIYALHHCFIVSLQLVLLHGPAPYRDFDPLASISGALSRSKRPCVIIGCLICLVGIDKSCGTRLLVSRGVRVDVCSLAPRFPLCGLSARGFGRRC